MLGNLLILFLQWQLVPSGSMCLDCLLQLRSQDLLKENKEKPGKKPGWGFVEWILSPSWHLFATIDPDVDLSMTCCKLSKSIIWACNTLAWFRGGSSLKSQGWGSNFNSVQGSCICFLGAWWEYVNTQCCCNSQARKQWMRYPHQAKIALTPEMCYTKNKCILGAVKYRSRQKRKGRTFQAWVPTAWWRKTVMWHEQWKPVLHYTNMCL